MGKIYSIKNIFGGSTYYDEDGVVIGRSVRNIFGGETIYDRDGDVSARTVRNIFGGETIYTEDGSEPCEFDRWEEKRRLKDQELEAESEKIRKKFLDDSWEDSFNL